MRAGVFLFAVLALAACASERKPADAPSAIVLPFISDDYATALAQAKTRQVPLFVESWAPW